MAIIAFASFQTQVQAQVDATVGPLGLLFGKITVGADVMVSEQFSIEGNVGYVSRDDKGFSDQKYTSVPVMAIGKYYFNPDKGADKFYASVFLRYVNRSYSASLDSLGTSNTAAFTQSRIGAGFGIGTKMVSRSNIVFDFGLQLGRVLVDNTEFKNPNDPANPTELPGLGFIFNVKLGVGYRFGG